MTVDNYIAALEKIKFAICEVIGALHAEKIKYSQEQQTQETSTIEFTEKEIEKLSKQLKLLFKAGRIRATLRKRSNNVYEIRCQFNKHKIAASSKNLETAKQKFLLKLNEALPIAQPKLSATVLFSDYAQKWLEIKKRTVKQTTYNDYERSINIDILPALKNKRLNEIDRQTLQDLLFNVVDAGLTRKAKKMYMVLRSIFEYAEEDFNLTSPVKKIVLPRYVEKKGTPLTLEEETLLVNHCLRNINSAGASALLVLLHFGLRVSELKTLTVGDNSITVITSKTRFGCEEVKRTIPFTTTFRRILPYVDFLKAKKTNVEALRSMFKRLLPNHHVHELRYTFITRCKESGVNLEVVMLFAGHESDKDVATSRVNRGYTVYNVNYLHEEAKKVNYIVDINAF